jgi:hypothetical protein
MAATPEIARENGKKGGRPLSEATIRAQLAREYISKQVEDSLAPIVAKAITQAMEGDAKARDWLSDRSWGRAPINLGVDDDGQPVKVLDIGAQLTKVYGDEPGDSDEVPDDSETGG